MLASLPIVLSFTMHSMQTQTLSHVIGHQLDSQGQITNIDIPASNVER